MIWYLAICRGGGVELEKAIVSVFGSLDIVFFFFNDTATTEIYTLSLHDALPILPSWRYENHCDFVPTGAISPWLRGQRDGLDPPQLTK